MNFTSCDRFPELFVFHRSDSKIPSDERDEERYYRQTSLSAPPPISLIFFFHPKDFPLLQAGV